MWLPNATGVLVAAPAGGRSTTPAGGGSAAYNTLILGPCHRGHRRRTGQCSVPDDAGGRVLDQRVALSHRPRRKLGKLLGCGLPDGLVLTPATTDPPARPDDGQARSLLVGGIVRDMPAGPVEVRIARCARSASPGLIEGSL
jgi:hypothetical protein